jgi:hypothetical protein
VSMCFPSKRSWAWDFKTFIDATWCHRLFETCVSNHWPGLVRMTMPLPTLSTNWIKLDHIQTYHTWMSLVSKSLGGMSQTALSVSCRGIQSRCGGLTWKWPCFPRLRQSRQNANFCPWNPKAGREMTGSDYGRKLSWPPWVAVLSQAHLHSHPVRSRKKSWFSQIHMLARSHNTSWIYKSEGQRTAGTHFILLSIHSSTQHISDILWSLQIRCLCLWNLGVHNALFSTGCHSK